MDNETNNEQNLPVKKQVVIPSDIEAVLINGDLSKLTATQRVNYYRLRCESLGVDPLSRPFDYMVLQGKLVLYGNKNLAEQLRHNHGVSIGEPDITEKGGVFLVRVAARNKYGREDADLGCVPVAGLKPTDFCNAMMKAVTKAKRRVTLSLCAAGVPDETEVDSIQGAKRVKVDHDTGEILDTLAAAAAANGEASDAEPSQLDYQPQAEAGEWIYKPPYPKKDAIKAAGARWHGASKTWRSSSELPEFAQWLAESPQSADPQVDPMPADDVPDWMPDEPPINAAPKPEPKKPAAPQPKPAQTFSL